jgi:predicted aspartyl protease
MRLALAALIALSLLGSQSEADDAFHCPEPGTVLRFTEGTVLTFTTQDGLICRARSNKGALFSQFLGIAPAELELEKHEGERLFPWRVGSQVEFLSPPTPVNTAGATENYAKDAYFDNSFKVVRQEKLTTAAGTFDTVVIEWHRQVRGRWLGTWLTTIWLAPELGFAVKVTRETRQGPGLDLSYELASVTSPRQGAAAARAAPSPEPSPLGKSAAAAPAQSSGTMVVVDTIKLEQAGSMFLVPAEVNGKITLNFILDSGASDLAIPADVVQTLTRAGAISTADFIGTKTYVLADGSKLPSEGFIVHELRVGNRVLKNIAAHVTPVQGSPLLGQSFLSRLSAWSIDNKQHTLIVMGDPGEPAAPTPTQPVAAPPQVVAAPPPKSAPAPPPTASPPTAPAPATSSVAPTPPIAIASAANAAGEVVFRCPRSGTVIEYSNGIKLKFAGENGFRCAYVDQSFTRAEKFAAFADDASLLNAGMDKLWPLKIGKEQTIGMTISGAYQIEHFTTLRRETIVVPAGTFDTFVVAQEESGGSRGQRSQRLFWYSPGLGMIVKSTFSLLTSSAGHWEPSTGGSLLSGDYEAVHIVTPGGVSAQ